MRYVRRRFLAAAPILMGLALVPSAALAQYQLPPHVPGTICATPQGWCWLPQQGYLGSPCACPNGYGGWVSGVTS